MFEAKPANEGERCDDCRRAYETVYLVPDDAWKVICPKPWTGAGSGGLLCPACADRRARERGVRLWWWASTDHEEWSALVASPSQPEEEYEYLDDTAEGRWGVRPQPEEVEPRDENGYPGIQGLEAIRRRKQKETP